MDRQPNRDTNELEILRERLWERDRDLARAENEIKRQEARVENARRWSEERELEFQQLERENASLRETNAAQLKTINRSRKTINGRELVSPQLLVIEELAGTEPLEMVEPVPAAQGNVVPRRPR